MSDTEQAQILLKMAHKDAKALKVMMDPEEVDDEIFGFHVQQSAEKSVKAWLIILNISYPKTHDLYMLVDLLETNKIDFSQWRDLTEFTEFSVQYRYEAFESFESFSREDSYKKLSLLLGHVEALLGTTSSEL